VASGATLVLNNSGALRNGVAPITLAGNLTGDTTGIAVGGFHNALGALTMNGGTLTTYNGVSLGFQAYALKGDVSVGGSSASYISAGGTSGFNGVHLADNAAGVTRIFDVADVTTSSAADLIVSARLLNASGAGAATALTKSGAGTLVLSGSNSYTGSTTISEGTLSFLTATALYGGDSTRWTSGNISAASGSTIAFGVGGADAFSSTELNTIIGNLTQNQTTSGGIQAGARIGLDTNGTNATISSAFNDRTGTDSGTLSLVKMGEGTLTLTGNNTYTGGTTLSGGLITMNAPDALGTTGNITFSGGGLQFLASGTSDVSSRIKNSTSAVLLDTNAQNITFGSAIDGSNTGGLTKIGSGTLTLSASNSYTGTTTIDAGTLNVSGTVADVSNNSNFTVQSDGAAGAVSNNVGATATNNGSVASLANAGTFTNSGNITGGVTTNGTLANTGLIGGALEVDGGSATIAALGQVAGSTKVTSGTLDVIGTVADVTNSASLVIQTGGTAGNVTNQATAINTGTVASLVNTGTFTNSANITGSVSTSGTLASTGTIGGALTIGGGETTITGTVVGATTVTAGTLQGDGTLGAVFLNSGGAIAPGTGNSIATLTVGNSVWNGGGIYNWQTSSLNGTAGSDWDLITSGGALSLNATKTNRIRFTLSTLGNATLAGVKNASWEVASFQSGISGFEKKAFVFDPAGMTGNSGRYFMSLGANNTALILNYKSAATWTTGSGNWTTATQWEDEAFPENDDEVKFAGPGGTSTNNFASGNLSTISGFNFVEGAGAYIINGNTLQIGEVGITNASGNLQTIGMDLTAGDVLKVDAAANGIEISGVISGNSELTKNGSSTLTLSGNNTYSGLTTISAGTLALGGTAGAIISNVSVDSGATFAVNRTNEALISNIISGAGSFAQIGSGVTRLQAINTHTGGTTISSGKLWVEAPQALGTGNVAINGGKLLATSSQERIMGNQTLSIGGNLDWTGGRIAFYATGTSPLAQDLKINVAGNFTVSTPGNATFDFSEVQALDSGVYTLVSTNGTVTAENGKFTAVHGEHTKILGSFTTTNNSVLYAVTGAESTGPNIQNNGGPNTPIMADYISAGPTITIGESNLLKSYLFRNNDSLTIQSGGQLTVTSGTLGVQSGSSVVSGGMLKTPGNLNKTGAGELDLESDTNVNGVATVVDGVLAVNGRLAATEVIVDPLATLGGAGLIVAPNVVVNGFLSPGNSPGTLSVAGNLVLTGANATVIEIASPTNFDRIVVSGQATLGGTLEAESYEGAKITPGTRYDFLQAGSIVGEFDSIVVPDGLRWRFLNLGTVGSLLFGPESFVPYALNPNQRNVAKALDTFILATEGDAVTVGTALDSLTAEQFPAVFDQIMPGFYESLANIAIEQTYTQTQLLSQRLGTLRLGATGFQAIGLSQPIKYDKDGKSTADAKTASPIVESTIDTNWNAWVMANGEFSISRGLVGVPSYNNNAGGFLVGADYRLSENFVAGLFAGYEYSYAKYNGGSSTQGNSALFGLYGSYTHVDGYYADAIVSGGYTGFQTRRSIEFGAIDRTARANPDSGQFSAALNLGKDFEVGKFTLGPIIGAQYTYAGIGGFTETGADSLDLALGQQNANSLRTNLGARLAYNWEVASNITLIPEVRGFWMHEFLNEPRNINSALEGGSGPSFDYVTSAPYSNSVFGGAGISAKVGDRWSASAFYNVNFGAEGYTNNTISTSLGFSF
jgi:autotransporter-associated beta strand protein